jgi:predicted aspartyl protease
VATNLLRKETAAVIIYTPGRPIVVSVTLNGRATARLVLDTGADVTMVRPRVLAVAGVDLSQPAARGGISGVAGSAMVSYFPVDLEVAGHRERIPRVAAFDTSDRFTDGLLGRDFLELFRLTVDPTAGTVTLAPR